MWHPYLSARTITNRPREHSRSFHFKILFLSHINVLILAALAVGAGWCQAEDSGGKAVDGLTFAVAPGKVFISLEDGATRLGWKVDGRHRGAIRINNKPLPTSSFRELIDGTALIALSDLEKAGATVQFDPGKNLFQVTSGNQSLAVRAGRKQAIVYLTSQRLQAWQGNWLVLDTHISSGRGQSTPTGDFTAGPYKARQHYSRIYDNAPMPWSVQISGNIFIHGFTVVPDYPASHGCIRLPLDGGNPARFFYEWIDLGTPVQITRDELTPAIARDESEMTNR